MLNNRSAIEFHNRLLKSGEKLNIKPISHIHDAQYFLVRNNIKSIKWLNDNLIECMSWQELPEIKHDEVKLGGGLELYPSNWDKHISIPNNASEEVIQALLDKGETYE